LFPDRITRTVRDVLASHGYNVQRTQTYVWTTDNQDVSTVISIQETAVNALRSWSTSYGLTSQSQTTINGNVTVTDTAADNSYTVTQLQNGQVQSTTHYNSAGGQLGQTSYQYDNHKRQWKVTDARTGTTTYGYNIADQITTVTTPVPAQGENAQTTTTYYDNMGRPWKIVLPDNTSVTNEYYLDGALKKDLRLTHLSGRIQLRRPRPHEANEDLAELCRPVRGRHHHVVL
jgi:hypothetical protein